MLLRSRFEGKINRGNCVWKELAYIPRIPRRGELRVLYIVTKLNVTTRCIIIFSTLPRNSRIPKNPRDARWIEKVPPVSSSNVLATSYSNDYFYLYSLCLLEKNGLSSKSCEKEGEGWWIKQFSKFRKKKILSSLV